MSESQAYEEEKFKLKLVGYESSVASSDNSDTDSSSSGIPNKKLKPSRSDRLLSENDAQLRQLREGHKDAAYKSHDTGFLKKEFSHPVFGSANKPLEQGAGVHNRKTKGRRERQKATEQELLVFGYTSKLYDLKESVENGSFDLLANGNSPEGRKGSIWVKPSLVYPGITLDRFDVRNLLDGASLDSVKFDAKGSSESQLNQIRYEYLDSDEEELFDMEEEERMEFLANKSSSRSSTGQNTKLYDFDYDNKGRPAPSEASVGEELEFSFPIPKGMSVPRTLKQLLVIERTAKFIVASSDPLLEVKIQGRQGNLAEFGFLNRDNPLHDFFQKVKTLIKLGLYSYCETEGQELGVKNKPEAGSSPECVPLPPPKVCEPSSMSGPSDEPAHLAPDQKHFIALFAKAVAFKGPTFEQKFRAEKSSTPEFSFLLPWDKLHSFYLRQLEVSRTQQSNTDTNDLDLVLPAKEFETNQWVSILSQQVVRLGEKIESYVYNASLLNEGLAFVFPWCPLNKYYCWKKKKLCNKRFCGYSEDDLLHLVASQVSLRGPEFEKQLQVKLCLDDKFSFLMPWDMYYSNYKEKVALATTKQSVGALDDCKMASRFARMFAIYGPKLEHQLRSLLFMDDQFSFLLPWGCGYQQFLECLSQELLHATEQPKYTLAVPPSDMKPFIDRVARAITCSDAQLQWALLINPSKQLSFFHYGHPYHNYYLSKVYQLQKSKRLHLNQSEPPDSEGQSKVQGVIGQPVKVNCDSRLWFADLPIAEEIKSLFSLELPATSKSSQWVDAFLPRMELCAWLQARFPWFESHFNCRQELPFLSPTHPLHAEYTQIAIYPMEESGFSVDDPLFPIGPEKLVIDALARLASIAGLELQQFLLECKKAAFSKSFPFLQPGHPHHVYYLWKVAFPNSEYEICNTCVAAESSLGSSPATEKSVLMHNTAAFVVRHGQLLESLLWPNTSSDGRFSFVDTNNEHYSHYKRMKETLPYIPLETIDGPIQYSFSATCTEGYIDRIAGLVSEMGAAFESQLLLDYPTELAFLHPKHPNYAYYSTRRKFKPLPTEENILCPSSYEPSSELTELQKNRLARVKKLLVDLAGKA